MILCTLCKVRPIRLIHGLTRPVEILYCVRCARLKNVLGAGEIDPEPEGFSEFVNLISGYQKSTAT